MPSRPPQSCRVYTPDDLSAAIVEAIGDEENARWLEPSHGDGAFLRAMTRLGVERRRITGIDLDAVPHQSDNLARTKRGVDFLEWAGRTKVRFDRIVGNPPYLAVHQLPRDLQQVAAAVRDANGNPVGSSGNLWQAFMYASLRLLLPGGSIGFVLPSAAEYANYSEGLRRIARDRFDVLEVYRCRKPLFDDVQEGTVVVIARGYGGGPCRFRRKEVATREALITEIRRRAAVRRSRCPGTPRAVSRVAATFEDVATIGLGGVTGDARFFLLSESDRKLAGLPVRSCRPVVSRSRHIRAAMIDDAWWQRLKKKDERIWLFDPPNNLLDHPAVRRRLRLKHSTGGCNRDAYKVSKRDPWYRTPMPETPDAFMSGMQSGGPWLTLNQMPNLNATNTLYVVHFKNSVADEERFAIALAFLTTDVRKQLNRTARRYADGLQKHEPGALRAIRLPRTSNRGDCEALYLRAMKVLLNGDSTTAQRLADDFFEERLASPMAMSVAV